MCNTLLQSMMPEILILTILTLVLLIVVSVVNKDCKAYLLSKKVLRPTISFLMLLGIITIVLLLFRSSIEKYYPIRPATTFDYLSWPLAVAYVSELGVIIFWCLAGVACKLKK